jgi:hypothetical protein
MRQLTIAAATVAIGIDLGGPGFGRPQRRRPIKQNGQCWKPSKSSEQMFGYWRACTETAGSPAAPAAQRIPGRRS